MAIYAIGDVQGCYDPLQRLLEQIAFDGDKDTLWFCGDLVNRGPKSLKTLRFVKQLGDRAITVLGNHDLHLMGLATGAVPYSRRFESLKKVLNAPDLSELLGWLRHRPLAHYDPDLDTLLVHAGTHPTWSIRKTMARAAEVEAALMGDDWTTLLVNMYGNTPRRWSKSLSGYRRLRFIINTFTRMRMLSDSMSLNFAHAGPPWNARGSLVPWFDVPERASGNTRIVFGHWSALGLLALPRLICLDTGCVWGRQLTAMRLDQNNPEVFQVRGR